MVAFASLSSHTAGRTVGLEPFLVIPGHPKGRAVLLSSAGWLMATGI